MRDEAEMMSAESGKRFKPYPAYKDSGMEWLGKIPPHWIHLASGRLIDRVEQGWSPLAEDRLAGVDEWAVIKLSAVNKGRFLPDEHKAFPPDLAPDNRYEIREGDFLLTRANTPDLVGDVCVARGVRPGLMLCDLVYRLRLRTDLVASEFLEYWLLSRPGRYRIEVDARGSSQSMVKISQGHIRAWRVALPPLDEQRAIAAFLSRETGKIDALVAKKERLIELLQEKRTALITRAVTKGLDLNVPMKDSGVEWLGKIPAHWELKRLKYLSSINDEALPEDTDPNLEISYVDIGNVDTVAGIVAKEALVFEDAPSRARRIVRNGDVIVSTVRTYLRAIAPIRDPDPNLIVSTGFAVIRPKELETSFAAYAVRAPYFVDRVVAHSVGVSYPAINASEIACFPIAYPDVEEQRAITAFLDPETGKIDALVAKIRDAIDRLKEFRSALISAAVTGKIDVREDEE